MPRSAPQPCAYPGCGVLTENARCPKHEHAERCEYDRRRGSSTERGYGYRWQKASKAFLRLHPLCQCEDCREGLKRVMPSQVVDHIVPHRGDQTLFWDQDNWQAMSKPCHDRKTARIDRKVIVDDQWG